MSNQDLNTRGPKPVAILREGALKVSIFRNETERGENYAMVPGRIYTDKETGQVREATSLSGSEPLRMAHLLTKSHDRVTDLRQQAKLKDNHDKERQPQQQAQRDRER